MTLKYDCVRDILIFCEKELTLDSNLAWVPIHLDAFCSSLTQHSREDIAYTLYLLDEAGYIDCHITEADGGIFHIIVYRLTYSGHEFLDTIKSDNVWQKIKTTVASVGSASIPVIQTLGTEYLTKCLTQL